MKVEARSCPLRVGLITSEEAQRSRVKSHRLSPRSYKERPFLPVHWGSRSNLAWQPKMKNLVIEPSGMSKDPATPLWLKDSSERKPMPLIGLGQYHPPLCRIWYAERKASIFNNHKGKNKAHGAPWSVLIQGETIRLDLVQWCLGKHHRAGLEAVRTCQLRDPPLPLEVHSSSWTLSHCQLKACCHHEGIGLTRLWSPNPWLWI